MEIQLLTKDDIISLEDKLNRLMALVENKPNDSIYSSSELAAKLNVSTKTISNWRKQKLIQFSQVNNRVFFTDKSVQEFLSSHSIKRFTTYK